MATQKRSALSYLTPARIVALLLVVLAVAFVLQNRASTAIQVFWIRVDTPLWFTLLAVFILGWVVGVLTARRGKDDEHAKH
jgi:putative membrane protein